VSDRAYDTEGYVQSGPEKIAESSMHDYSASVCSRIKWFSPKCSGKTSQCKFCISWLNILWQTARIGYMSGATLPCM